MRCILVLTLLVSMASFAPAARAESTCELTPLTLPLFDATPLAELSTPIATPATHQLTDEEANEILEMYVACTNTGDPTLVWAMFTPRWFSVQFADSEEHYLPAFEYDIATGHNEVTDPLSLTSVDKIELQSDGRMAVTATFTSGSLKWTDQLMLMNIDGQWLIDEVVLVSPSE